MAKRPNCSQFLADTLAALDDDYSQPWESYPCLEWPFTRYKKEPYGLIHKVVDGHKTTRRVHREAWKIVFGPIGDSVLVCHHCDNPACYRPIHLFKGSNSDNMVDCYQKGRHFDVFAKYPELRKRGEEHANAILTDAIITEIRTLCLSMSQSAVGRNFGISQSHVSQIVNRKIWAHV